MSAHLSTPAIAADRSARYGRNFTPVDLTTLNPDRDQNTLETIHQLHHDGLFFLAEDGTIYIVPDGNEASDRPFQARPGRNSVIITTRDGVEDHLRWVTGHETFYSFVNRVLQVGMTKGKR